MISLGLKDEWVQKNIFRKWGSFPKCTKARERSIIEDHRHFMVARRFFGSNWVSSPALFLLKFWIVGCLWLYSLHTLSFLYHLPTVIIPSSWSKSWSLLTPTNHPTIPTHEEFDPGSQPPSQVWLFWEHLKMLTGPSHTDLCQESLSIMNPSIKRVLIFNFKNNSFLNCRNLICQAVVDIPVHWPQLLLENLFQHRMALILASSHMMQPFLSIAILNERN